MGPSSAAALSRRRSVRAAALLALLVVAPEAVGASGGRPAVRAEVAISVDPHRWTLEGEVELRVRNDTAAALDHVDLWLFPERLSEPPPGLDEVMEPRVFPEGFDPGGMRLLEVRDGSGRPLVARKLDRTTARVGLESPVPPGREAVVRARFRTRVPHRFGPFGHANDQLTLDGGFFPRPPPLGPDGFRRNAPPDPIAWRLRLRWDGLEEALAVVGGAVGTLRPTGGEIAFGPARGDRIPLVIMTEFHGSHLEVDGTRIRFLHRRPRRAVGRDEIVDLGFLDIHAQTLATVGAGVRFLGRAGIDSPPEILVVETGLRQEVALAAPGLVLVSDRAFAVTPYEPLRRFHRLPILRALFSVVLAPSVAPRGPPFRRAQTVDLVASELVHRWEAAQFGEHGTARDLLDKGSFVSEVDEMLNAPQIPFRATYFRSPDDTDPLRDRFTLFSHRRPSGGLWRDKLHDRSGAEAVRAVVEALLRGDLTLSEALEAHAPEAGISFLEQWAGGPPEVNYRLGRVRDGRDRQGPYVEVEILREGAPDLEEPVTVRLKRGRGSVEETVVVSDARTLVRVRTTLRNPEVILDPHHRLVESDLDRPVDPRFDNVRWPDWRFLLDGVGVSLNTATGRPDTTLLASLRRQHDATHVIRLHASDSERRTEFGATWLRGFGPKIVPNRRRFAVGTGLSGGLLKTVDGDPRGFGLRATLSLREMTYVSFTDPREGVWREVRAGPIVSNRGGATDVGGFGGFRLSRLVRVSWAHTFAGNLRFDGLWGAIPEAEAWPVGGIGGVRALATFARAGSQRGLASVEWRHRYARDLSVSVGHLAWIEGIDGVLFVDGAVLADDVGGLFEGEAVSLGPGYGLRVHYLLAGLNPMTFAVDVGFPLLTRGRLGVGVGPPWSVVLALGQAF